MARKNIKLQNGLDIRDQIFYRLTVGLVDLGNGLEESAEEALRDTQYSAIVKERLKQRIIDTYLEDNPDITYEEVR